MRCAPTAVGCQRCTTARKTCSLTGSPLAAYNQSTAFLPSTSSQLNEGPSPGTFALPCLDDVPIGPSIALLPPIPDANDLSPAHTDASDGTTQATFVDGIRGVVSTAGTHQFLNPFRDLAYASSTGSPGMPEKVEMTTSTMLLLRPLTLAINLLTHDPHNYGKASGCDFSPIALCLDSLTWQAALRLETCDGYFGPTGTAAAPAHSRTSSRKVLRLHRSRRCSASRPGRLKPIHAACSISSRLLLRRL